MITLGKAKIAFSSRSDGSMATGQGKPQTREQKANVEKFLAKNHFQPRRTSMQVTYDLNRSYTDIERITSENSDGLIYADAVYTTEPRQVLVLPVADCVATVIYDPATNMLGLLHLGRHSSVAGLIEAFIIEVSDVLGSDPHDWQIWMSPSLTVEHDRLDFFDPIDSEEWRSFVHRDESGIYIDTIGHNQARFIRAGVRPKNIIISPSDTYGDDNYFSHRAYLDGHSSKAGRMIVTAAITE